MCMWVESVHFSPETNRINGRWSCLQLLFVLKPNFQNCRSIIFLRTSFFILFHLWRNIKKNIKQPLGIPKRSFLGGRGAQPHSIAFGAVFCWIRSTYPHCAFPNVSSKCLRQGMHIYIGCIYFNFLYFWSGGCSHIDCICFTFFHCVFLNVSSKNLCGRLRSHIECTYLIFLYCVFSNVASNCLHERMHNRTGCTCLFFLHCALTNVSSNCLPEWMQSHTGYIYLTFLHCVFSSVSLSCLHHWMYSYTGCIC